MRRRVYDAEYRGRGRWRLRPSRSLVSPLVWLPAVLVIFGGAAHWVWVLWGKTVGHTMRAGYTMLTVVVVVVAVWLCRPRRE